MNITEKDILNLKQRALSLRDRIIQAKATYDEVLKNIESCKKELLDLGVVVEDDSFESVDEKIVSIEKEIEVLYDAAKERLEKWI